MTVSMELDARKSPKGWKPRLVIFDLCPIRVLKTVNGKQQRDKREDGTRPDLTKVIITVNI